MALATFIIMLTTNTVWSVFNLFFLIGSAPLNLVYFGIFLTVQLAFTLVSAGYFLNADGLISTAVAVNKTAGAFAFASGMLGYYTLGNLMCQEALGFNFPMGDTSRFFKKKIA
jgi:succinate-acetate transporter protein